MQEPESLGSFLKSGKKLVKEYLTIRMEIYRLELIRGFSRSAGFMLWLLISFLLLFLLIIFGGLVTGFWLSEVTGSYVKGFGLTALIILVKIILLAIFRNSLFINPIVRRLLRRSMEDSVIKEKPEEN